MMGKDNVTYICLYVYMHQSRCSVVRSVSFEFVVMIDLHVLVIDMRNLLSRCVICELWSWRLFVCAFVGVRDPSSPL